MCFKNVGGKILCNKYIWQDSDQSIKEEDSKDCCILKTTFLFKALKKNERLKSQLKLVAGMI